MMLTDPAKEILASAKTPVIKDGKPVIKEEAEVLTDVREARMDAWQAPALKKDRDDARAARIEDWKIQSGGVIDAD
jgi:hypothetical protein